MLNAAIRPEQLEALVVSESPDDWGRQLVRAADKVWTSPAAPALKAVVRRVLVGPAVMAPTEILAEQHFIKISSPSTRP